MKTQSPNQSPRSGLGAPRQDSRAMQLLAFLAILSMSCSAVSALDIGKGEKPSQLIMGPSGPVPVYVSAEKTEILDAPKAKSKILRHARFLEPYYLAKGPVKEGKSEFVLAATADENLQLKDLIGWINTRDCVMTREGTKTKHGIYRKALIVNDWKRLKSVKDKSKIAGTSVLNGPGKAPDGKDYDTLSEIGLYDFYYIYGEETRGGKNYFLLGDRPIIVSHRQPQEAIRGWVADARIFRWDTRQAIEFNKDNIKVRNEGKKEADKGVKIFATGSASRCWPRWRQKVPVPAAFCRSVSSATRFISKMRRRASRQTNFLRPKRNFQFCRESFATLTFSSSSIPPAV